MDYERYKKYFLARTFAFRYVGIALVALGALMFFLGYFTFVYMFMPFGGIALVLGGIVGWAPSIGRADDKEILSAISRKTEGAEESAVAETGLRSRMVETLPPIKVTGYLYDVKNPYIRRGGDDHWRTSDCVCTVLIFAKSGVCAVSDGFSLVEDKSRHDIYQLPFADFDGAHFETEEDVIAYKNKSETAKFSRLVFTLGESAVLTIPAERTSTVEMAIEEILRQREIALREAK